MLILTSICYATGMIGANNRDETLNYVFAGFSIALGILMPIIRIRFDDEVSIFSLLLLLSLLFNVLLCFSNQ